MRFTAPWIMVAIAVAVGTRLPLVTLPWWCGIGTVAACGVLIGANRLETTARWCAIVALIGLSLARGVVGSSIRTVLVPRAGFYELVTLGASSPGRRCRVYARPVEGSVHIRLSLPPSACPLAHGQRVLIADPKPERERATGRSHLNQQLAERVDALWWANAAWTRSLSSSIFWARVAAIRQRAWVKTRGRPALAFVASSLLGMKAALPPEDRAALRDAGVSHLVAVSGMHVGLAAFLMQRIAVQLVLRLRGKIGYAVALGLIPMIGYVLLTGASASSIRAAIMHTLIGLGPAFRRAVHGTHVLSVAAALMLLWHPGWVYDPGFQFSLVAMAALVTATDDGVLAQTWRVAWAVAPLSLMYGGDFNPAGVIANLIAIPVFSFWVAPVGALGWLCESYTEWLLLGSAWGAETILVVARLTAKCPRLPTWSLVVAAGLGVLGHGWWGRAHRWTVWLPPPVAAVSVMMVVLFQSWSVGGQPPHWMVSTGRDPTVLGVNGAGDACVHLGSRAVDASWLRAVGVRHIHGMTRASGPHITAWRQAMRAEGLMNLPISECEVESPALDEAWIRDARNVCRTWVGAPRADHPSLQCWTRDGWKPLAIAKAEDIGDER